MEFSTYESSSGLMSGMSDVGDGEDFEAGYYGEEAEEANRLEDDYASEEGIPYDTEEGSSGGDDNEYNLADFVNEEFLQEAHGSEIDGDGETEGGTEGMITDMEGGDRNQDTEGASEFSFDAGNLVTTDADESQEDGGSSEGDLTEEGERGQDGAGERNVKSPRAYEELARRKRGARKQQSTTVAEFAKELGKDLDMNLDHIWQSEAAENMGLAPRTGVAGRRMRRRERWREKNPKMYRRWRGEPPVHLKNLMGRAHDALSDNRLDTAWELAQQAVKADSNFPDSYFILGEIATQRKNHKKAFSFYWLEANLREKDAVAWERVGHLAKEAGNLNYAVEALSKAVRIAPRLDLHLTLVDLLSKQGDTRKALRSCEAIFRLVPGHREATRLAARLYFGIGEKAQAMQLLEEQLRNYREQADETLINMLAEVYMDAREWQKAFLLIREEEEIICKGSILPADLQFKAGTCAVQMGQMEVAQQYFASLLTERPDYCPDLLLSIGETYMELGLPQEAINYFSLLQEVPEYNTPALWARLVQCQAAMGELQPHEDIYRSILNDERVPAHEREDAALSLVEEYLRGGDEAAARMVLCDISKEFATPDVSRKGAFPAVMRRAKLVLQLQDEGAYLDLMLPLLVTVLRAKLTGAANMTLATFHSLTTRLDELVQAKRWQARSTREQGQQPHGPRLGLLRSKDMDKHQSRKGSEGVVRGPPGRVEASMGETALADALERTLKMMLEAGCPEDAQLLGETGMALFDRSVRQRLRVLMTEILLDQGKTSQAYEYMRGSCHQWPDSVAVWNLYARVAAAVGSAGHNMKLSTKLRQKNPSSVPIMLNLAYCYAMQGQHSRAISELFQTLRALPGQPQPLPLLCLALAFLSQALGKRLPDRAATLLQAFAFLEEYRRQRGNEQEAAYNMGRAAQQLGIMHLALDFYQKVLDTPPPDVTIGMLGKGKQGRGAGSLDLTREAAHNMALIYRASGADELAKEVLRKYFTV